VRILYHHRTLGDGAEGIHIREMVAAFRALGHEVHVAALVGEAVNDTKGAAARQRRWSWVSRAIPGGVYELAELGYNVVGRANVARAIRKFKPNFVFDRYNSYSTAAVRAARRAAIPVVLEVNAPVAYERSAYEKLPLNFPRLAKQYEEKILGQADHILAVSTPLKDFLTTNRQISPSKITVLPNGANPQKFDPRLDGSLVKRRWGLIGKTVIGFVGILRPWHGTEMLIRAFSSLIRRVPRAHLLLVGDGPSEAALREQAALCDLQSHITFTGRIPHADVCDHIAAMDIAVSPRATFYASPMKILEYMAMAVPVVAPDTPNIRDIVKEGHEGLLFRADDEKALEEALHELVANASRARRMGEAGRRRIEQERNWESNAAAVVAIVNTLLPQACHGKRSTPRSSQSSLIR
jgi:glycosyltransferase involved in cell wall biosynthesis